MDQGFSGNNRLRQDRGRGMGPDRSVKRVARNMTLKNGGGEAARKFHNKTWRRDDATSEDNGRQDNPSNIDGRDGRSANPSHPLFPSESKAPSPFGVNVNGVNGSTQIPQANNDNAVSSGVGSSGSPFGSSIFGTSVFGQSASHSPTSAFSTTPASSPPRRNAFGALIDSESGQSVMAFSNTTSSLSQSSSSTSPFGPFPPAPSNFGSPSPFGATPPSVSAFQTPKSSVFNPAATEFKPASAAAKAATASVATSPFSRAFASSVPTSTSGFTSKTPLGNVKSVFSTSVSSPAAPQKSFPAPKSAFTTSNFTPSHSSPPQTNGARSAFPPSRENVSIQESRKEAPISASAREGGHISTSRFRFKNPPPWKTQRSSPASSALPQPPKHTPPYRVPPNIQREIDQGNFATDNRFPGNRFMELKALRPSMRAHSIKHKLISDPEHRTDLTGAITVVGTCMEMCPEFERHEREFQKDVDDWEKIPGTNPKRIDHARAVKKYRRSAAGNDEPLESDLRPPVVLKRTLDYLFYELLDKHGLEATYAFIRDRTRAIRTDFTIQHEKGPIAIECFERIARFHILALHRFCERDDVRGFDYWQEVEQMMKTLQSLMQFYDDNEGKIDSPNEAEFRSYYILAHIRDTNSIRRLQALAPHIFLDPVLQTAIEFHSYAQRNTHVERRSGHRAAKLKFRNSEACQNAFTRFFKRVRNEGTSYLMACLLEYHFGAVRKGAIHSLWKAYTARHRPLPTAALREILGMDDEVKTLEIARRFGIPSVEENGDVGGTAAVQLNKNSKFDYTNQMSQRHSLILVETKRGEISDVEIVDGRFEKAGVTWTSAESEVAMFMPVSPAPAESSHQAARKASVVDSVAFDSASTPSSFPSSVEQRPKSSLSTSINWNSLGGHGGAYNASDINRAATLPSPPKASQLVPESFVQTTPTPLISEPVRTLTTLPALWPSVSAISPPSAGVVSPAPRTEAVVTPPIWTPEVKEPPPVQQTTRPVEVHESQNVSAEASLPSPKLDIDTNTPPPPFNPPSPSRPTQEELLYAQKQASLRASALARSKADRQFKFKALSTTFTHWKRSVMNRGRVRALREDREERFRRSIRDMGLSTNSPTDDRKGKQKAVYVDEDLVSWEDTSQASSNTSIRKRRRKSATRADDDAILAAIKEAEATRLKLWERRTFLTSVIRHLRNQLLHPRIALPHGWQVWLSTSTTADNTSTTEWLRVKFGANASTASMRVPGLDRISLSKADMPPGHTRTAGLIVFDLSTSATESAIQADCQRLLNLISLLPSNRHYIPSVILLHWTESADFFDHIYSLLNDLQRDNYINAWRILSFINDGQHFDDQFYAGINDLPMDTVGKLMELTSIDDVYQMFFRPWDTALDQGISICQSHQPDDFDWCLYEKVLAIMLDYINRLVVEVLRICDVEISVDSLPPFDASSIFDQHSAYEALMRYLNIGWLPLNQDAVLLRAELSADLFAGREFYLRAIPERLAHLMLCKLRASIPPGSNIFLHTKSVPSSVASFTEAIHASLAQLERHSLSKKRNASEVAEDLLPSQPSVVPVAKKRKTGPVSTVTNGLTSQSVASNSKPHAEDKLKRLKNTIAGARRSIDDLRMQRDVDQRSLSPPDESDSWTTPDSSPKRLHPDYPGRTLIGLEQSIFAPRIFDLPLIPRDEFEVIPAKLANTLIPSSRRQSPSRMPARTKHNDPLLKFHPFLNGHGRNHPSVKSALSPRRVHGAASLTPRASEQAPRSLEALKMNLQRAQDAVEASRRSREASKEA